MVAELLELEMTTWGLSSSTLSRMGMLSLIPGAFFGTQQEGCTLEVLRGAEPGQSCAAAPGEGWKRRNVGTQALSCRRH